LHHTSSRTKIHRSHFLLKKGSRILVPWSYETSSPRFRVAIDDFYRSFPDGSDRWHPAKPTLLPQREDQGRSSLCFPAGLQSAEGQSPLSLQTMYKYVVHMQSVLTHFIVHGHDVTTTSSGGTVYLAAWVCGKHSPVCRTVTDTACVSRPTGPGT